MTTSSLQYKSGQGCTLAWSLLLPLAYLLVVGRFGWSHADDGFILGYVWRLVNGEIPYRDFIYVRPPGSIYLHAMWFRLVPDNWVNFTGRAVYCLELMAASMVAAWALTQSAETPEFVKKNWRAFGGVAFVVSASTLIPFPWHTVDGIFFASLAGALILASRQSSSATKWKCLLGGCLLVMAALCKQSFYPWPIMLIALLAWDKEWGKVLWVAVGIAFASVVTFALMVSHGIWAPFSVQTTGNLALSDAFVAGVYPYIKSFFVIGLPTLFAIGATRFLAFKLKVEWSKGADAMVLALTTSCVWILLYRKFGTPGQAFINLWLDQTLWCIAAMWCLMAVLKGERPLQLVAWLLLAWCASISWGLMTPALFSLPSIVGAWLFFYASTSEKVSIASSVREKRFIVICASFLVCLALLRGATLEDWTYRLTCSASTVAPFYSGVMTSEENCQKLADMTEIVNLLPSKRIVFLPAFTTAYLQFGLKNPLPIDLPTVTEMAGSADRVMDVYRKDVEYVLIEKSKDHIFKEKNEKARFFVPLILEATENFEKISSTKYFDVFKNPNFKP